MTGRLVALCCGLIAATPALACTDREAAIAAVAESDVAAAAALAPSVATDPGCDDAFRAWMNEAMARLYARRAVAAEATPETRRADLEAALRHSGDWRLHDALGRAQFGQKDYAAAAASLQRAINALNEAPADAEVDRDDIEELVGLAGAAVALSGAPIDAPRTRSGRTGGLFSPSVRGFVVEVVPLPITFEFDSVIFDEAGRIYADELLAFLLETQPPSIRIAGHTDPVGGEPYNDGLSQRRAVAVRDYLANGGYAGEITVEWYGETVQPTLPPGVEPDSEAHYRLARRVELKR